MRICLLVEGSYPYIVGGVASWIQLLIQGMPEHEFIIYSIGAQEKDKGNFSYEIPENVIEIHELFLDSILNLKPSVTKQYKLSQKEKDTIEHLLSGQKEIELENLLEIFRFSNDRKDPMGIFVSFDFFDIVVDVYKKQFAHLSFTEFFWTIRSMTLPLFYLLQQTLPDADVYHSVAAGYCGIMGGIASAVYKKPFVVTEHGIYSREREEEIIKSSWAATAFKGVWIQYFYNLSLLTYQKANKVVTLFAKNAEIEIALGCEAEKIDIIPNAVLVDQYCNIKELAKKENEITIGAIVRVVPIKDIITMIRCFAMVKHELAYAKFKIVGSYEEDPDYYEECLKLVETLHLEDVEFTGVVDVKKYLNDLDIIVLSSISEAQPLVILEAFAAQRPVVSTDVGSCRELLYGEANDTFGQAGIIVPVMDFEGMAKAIIKLANNYDLRIQMARVGYKRVHAYYTYEKLIQSYRDLYKSFVLKP